jgi:hypothetical protein
LQTFRLRLQELAEIFAIAVGGLSVMHNHLHLPVHLKRAAAHLSNCSWPGVNLATRSPFAKLEIGEETVE